MRYEIQYFCISHQGNRRPNNQDNFICNNLFKPIDNTFAEPLIGKTNNDMPRLFGVFDGLGGEACGEIASYIAAETASQFDLSGDIHSRLYDFCIVANDRICQYSEENAVGTMGTTAAMLAFSPDDIYLCNIGDTKIFSFSGKSLEQISVDHVVTSAYGMKPPLSQDLGIPPTEMIIDPYIVKGRYNDGDIYLICSDGLTDMVDVGEIQRVLRKNKPAQALDALLEKALQSGGKDNITMIILKLKRRKAPFWKRKAYAGASEEDSTTEEIMIPEGTE
ncbi:MAG: SpoIIE family protein phosphatase [Oscillospiraceae bacterium]|nr:SpoIIE family protein phosphatase [Oscillospiraceae bacterium]